MTVVVVGLGHIGLPTALLLAKAHETVGVDTDDERVAKLNEGILPFEEPGLSTLFDSVQNNFTASTKLPEQESEGESGESPERDTYLIATPTPIDDASRVANLEYVRTAVETVANVLTPGDLVVLESTVPPGTTHQLVAPILEQSDAGPDGFKYAYCPERALPGNTIQEMIHNDRVIGGRDEASRAQAKQLYSFVEGSIYTTEPTSAEFIKLIENTYRDVNIALANELGKLAEEYGLDGRAAIEVANNHPRVEILSPGPGVGGHCLPIDPQFLTQFSENNQLISLARTINDRMPVHVLHLIRDLLPTRPDTRITILGVAYKRGVNDKRQTPARPIIRLSENEGYDVRVHDPHVDTFDQPLLDLNTAVDGSDCLVIVTDHDEYEGLEPEQLATEMRSQAVLDTRGILNRAKWEAAGFAFRSLADGS